MDVPWHYYADQYAGMNGDVRDPAEWAEYGAAAHDPAQTGKQLDEAIQIANERL